MATGRWHADALDRRQQHRAGRGLRHPAFRPGERRRDHRRRRCHDRRRHARASFLGRHDRRARGTPTINSTLAGSGGLAETGPGTLVLDGTLAYAGPTMVAGQGTLDLHVALGRPRRCLPAAGRLDPARSSAADGQSLYDLDPAMFTLVQSLFVDQAIDRADMIQILESAVVDGAVTPAALSALETLTTPQNESRLNMPDYVAVLANDVVWGNPANANYQGQALGNLADQGSDSSCGPRPWAISWTSGSMVPTCPLSMRLPSRPRSYSAVAGSLYGDNPDPALDVPSSADMHQGGLGDCYFVAAMGALADSSPAAIESMIIPNGVENGIPNWTVRFYYGGPAGYVADYVTVNAMLPSYPGGNLVL